MFWAHRETSHLTEHDRQRLQIAIAKCDRSLRAIARDMGIDDRTVRPNKNQMPVQVYRPFAVSAVVGGANYTDIAAKVGTSIYTVWKWVQDDSAEHQCVTPD